MHDLTVTHKKASHQKSLLLRRTLFQVQYLFQGLLLRRNTLSVYLLQSILMA